MTVVIAVDSFDPPTAVQLANAKLGGVGMWNGYLPGPGIDSAWNAADFARIRNAGLASIAYCSGRADPAAQRQLAAAWGVRPCLDVERGIRGDGAWVQPWLDASEAGLYHNYFVAHVAAFHVLAEYVGTDPRSSWNPDLLRPPTPCGWQWAANLQRYGAHVDLSWFDASFVQQHATPPREDEMFTILQVAGGVGDYLLYDDDHVLVGIYEPADVPAFQALKNCNGTASISAGMFARLRAVAPNMQPPPSPPPVPAATA